MIAFTVALTYTNVEQVSRLSKRPVSELWALLESSSEYEIKAGRVKVALPIPVNYKDGTMDTPVQSRYFATTPRGVRS